MRRILLSALLASASIPALATDLPAPQSKDGLVCTQPYDPNAVTTIHLEVGREVTIQLKDDEIVQKVLVSDLAGLASTVFDGRNIVWLKALDVMPPEPEVITTSRPDGTLRSYLLQVDARQPQPAGIQTASLSNNAAVPPPKPGAVPCYMVRFTYAADDAAKKAEAAAAARKAQIARWHDIQTARAFRSKSIANANWKYVGIGNRDLAPDHIFDDGYSTFLEYDGNRSVPAPYEAVGPDKDKLLPGFNAEQGACPGFSTPAATCLKLHAVVKRIRLRDQEDLAGKKPSLEIVNRGFNAVGDRPGTGTSSPDVFREVKP